MSPASFQRRYASVLCNATQCTHHTTVSHQQHQNDVKCALTPAATATTRVNGAIAVGADVIAVCACSELHETTGHEHLLDALLRHSKRASAKLNKRVGRRVSA